MTFLCPEGSVHLKGLGVILRAEESGECHPCVHYCPTVMSYIETILATDSVSRGKVIWKHGNVRLEASVSGSDLAEVKDQMNP